MRSFVALSLIASTILASEPSVFGAGNLNSPQPYGLTAEEKLILENKKEIESVAQKTNMQNAKVESATERIDGMQAIVEGLSQSVNEQKIALQKITESLSSDANMSGTIESLRQSTAANSANVEQLKTLLEELSHVVDGINTSYVTKEEFSLLVQQLKIKLPTVSSDKNVKMDPSSAEKKAKEFFGQQKYAEAQALYELMVQKKYKVAEANYWIGESYFERKNYKDAVSYYKESASKNDKASYMPTLLLHTGIAIEKNGDTASAKAFYKATISKFSGTGAADDAQARLTKLK